MRVPWDVLRTREVAAIAPALIMGLEGRPVSGCREISLNASPLGSTSIFSNTPSAPRSVSAWAYVNALEMDWRQNSCLVSPAWYRAPSTVATAIPTVPGSAPTSSGMEVLTAPPSTSRSSATTRRRYSVTGTGPAWTWGRCSWAFLGDRWGWCAGADRGRARRAPLGLQGPTSARTRRAGPRTTTPHGRLRGPVPMRRAPRAAHGRTGDGSALR